MRLRTVFISDVHLGSQYASVHELLDFLSHLKDDRRPDKLYIVGDFIDGWKLKRNWFWTNESNLVLRKLLKLASRGTQVYYVAGNHDEFLREFIDDFNLPDFGNIHIGNEFIHETATGTKLLVVHGDMFDMVTKYANWLCWLGDIGYTFLLWLNKRVNSMRRFLKLSHWSLSAAIKSNVKEAVNFVSDFEKCMEEYAIEKGCIGCVCGHIHSATLRRQGSFVYANTGDWVESCTAILEYEDGQLSLYKYHETVSW